MEAKNIIEVSHGDKLYLFCPHCGKRLTGKKWEEVYGKAGEAE